MSSPTAVTGRAFQHCSPASNVRPLLLWILISTAQVLIPLPADRFWNGLPLDHWLDFIAVFLWFALIFTGSPLVSRSVFNVCLGLALGAVGFRMAAAAVSPPQGLFATYRYEHEPGRLVQVSSTGSRRPQITKIDHRLEFEGVSEGLGRTPLWLAFLNELRWGPEPSDRLHRGLEVIWTGFVTADRNCSIRVESNGRAVLATTTQLVKGESVPLRVKVWFPSLENPRIRLLTTDDPRTVPTNWLSLSPSSLARRRLTTGLNWTGLLCLGLIVPLLVHRGMAGRRSRSIDWKIAGYTLVLCSAVVSGVVLWEHELARNPAMSILPPNDYLIYEDQARRLSFEGLLHDTPHAFVESPGMRYYLAACHLVFGEFGYGIVLWQQIVRGLTALLLLGLWNRLTGIRWWGWVVAGLVLFLPDAVKISLRYYVETSATLFVALTAWFMVKNQAGGRQAGNTVFTAASAGMAALLRSNCVVFLAGIPIWMLLKRARGRDIIVFLATMGLILSLVPVRNLLVTGSLVWWSTNAPIILFVGNDVPRTVDVTGIATGSPERDRIFRAGLDRILDFSNNPHRTFYPFPAELEHAMQKPLLRVFLAYVRQFPAHFAGKLLGKTQRLFLPVSSDRFVLVLSIFALLGLWSARRRGQLQKWSPIVALMTMYAASLILTNFYTRHRLVILPGLTLLSVFGAWSLYRKVAEARDGRRGRTK